MTTGGSPHILPGNSTEHTSKIGLIIGTNGVNDPYSQKAWKGLQRAGSDFNLEIGYVQAQNDKEYGDLLLELQQQNYQMIFTLGNDAVPAVLEAAKKNPATTYICLDAALENSNPDNVMAVTYSVEEAAFLAGYLTGKMTKTGVAGFIAGDNKDLAQKYYYAYKAGLRDARPYCELMKGLAATYTNKNRVNTIIDRMLDSKADLIFLISGKTDTGSIELIDGTNKTIAAIIRNTDEIIYDLSGVIKKISWR
jgi:basic membrane protein A